jgi:diguanylate cyclase (GGDEF)-like protein
MLQVLILVIGAILVWLLIWFVQRRNSFYWQLFELEEVFEGELNFSRLSKRILAKVLEKTAAFGGILYWLDETRKEFKIKTLLGVPAEQISRVTAALRGPDGILEQAHSSTDCYIIRQRSAANEVGPEWRLGEFCQSIMVIFLTSQNNPRGLMVIFKRERRFNAKHLRMMRVFAGRATVNLDNARLYQLAKETALENTRLYLNISKLYKQATLDELTGLYNRNFFMQRIKEEIKKAWRLKQPLALIFIDLDFFKNINDQYGHQVGDQLLLEFGNFLKAQIREYDIPCRFGGEEFILLLPHTNFANAFQLAERLRVKLAENQFSGVLRQIPVTASFGVNFLADFPETLARLDEEKVDAAVETLVSGADEALYRAKSAGRNQVQAFDSGIT